MKPFRQRTQCVRSRTLEEQQMGRIPLNPRISEKSCLTALGGPVAGDEANRNILEIGPALKGLG